MTPPLTIGVALALTVVGWGAAPATSCAPRDLNGNVALSHGCCCGAPESSSAPCATSCRRELPSASVTAEAPRPAPTMSASHVLAALVPAPFDPRLNLLHRETVSRSSPAPPARRYLLACDLRL